MAAARRSAATEEQSLQRKRSLPIQRASSLRCSAASLGVCGARLDDAPPSRPGCSVRARVRLHVRQLGRVRGVLPARTPSLFRGADEGPSLSYGPKPSRLSMYGPYGRNGRPEARGWWQVVPTRGPVGLEALGVGWGRALGSAAQAGWQIVSPYIRWPGVTVGRPLGHSGRVTWYDRQVCDALQYSQQTLFST